MAAMPAGLFGMKITRSITLILITLLLLSALPWTPQTSWAQQLPDLIITDISSTDSQVCYTLKNNGQASVGSAAMPVTFWNALFIDDMQNPVEVAAFSTTQIPGGYIVPGQQIQRCFIYQGQMTEQHVIKVCADWGQGEVEESNEQNNCLEETWIPELPDLIVEKIECGPGNKLLVTAKNAGSAFLPAGWSALAEAYFDGDRQGFFDLRFPTSTSGGGIGVPGGSSMYLLAWDIMTTVNVIVYVDYLDNIDESNEQNNFKTETVEPLTTPEPTGTPTFTPVPSATHTPLPPPPPPPSSPTPTSVIIIGPPIIVTPCWYSISGTIHDFNHDAETLKIEICDAETISLRPSDPSMPVLPPITQCKEDGAVWYADVVRQFYGDLPSPDLTYTFTGLCAGEYIVAPVYQSSGELCPWHGTWESARGQVVRIEDSSATGYDFTFVPVDSRAPSAVSINIEPEEPELKDDVTVTILAWDNGEIDAIWEKTDTVYTDGSSHPGTWNSLTVTPGLEGSTAGAEFSITDDDVAQATVRAMVCDGGGNSRSAIRTIIFDTCGDGEQSWGETGVDCGGRCPSRCMSCLGDSTIGALPSAYLYGYGSDDLAYIRSMADQALYDFATENSIDVRDLDTSDEYIDAVSWWVALNMGYRGDNINEICMNDIRGVDYDPDDYDHGDFPQPAHYTLRYSGCSWCDGLTYTVEEGHEEVTKTWHADPDKRFYGDCEDYGILTGALLRSLGVSHRCVFTAEEPGHSFNVVYYQGKFRVLEPQGGDPGRKYYGVENIWNDKLGAFACCDFEKVKPWEYTMNYPGCEGPVVSIAGGGFGGKTLWLDWTGWGENVKPDVADFNGDGKDDIAAMRVMAYGTSFEQREFRFVSSGSGFTKDFPETETGDSNTDFFYTVGMDDSVMAIQGFDAVEHEGSRVQRYGHVESPTANNFVTFNRNTHPIQDVTVTYSDETMPVFSIHDGWLGIEAKDTTTYDHWSKVNRAPQLQYVLGSDDWTIETSLRLSDTDPSYHAGLMVYFAENDIIYYGLHNGGMQQLRIERSGDGVIGASRYWPETEVMLKIIKTGTNYVFHFKAPDSTSWGSLASTTIDEEPVKVGFILKTWVPTAIKAEFDHFGYSSDTLNFTDNFDGALHDRWTIYIPRQTWHGSFCEGSEIPFVGDFDGDGTDDIVTFIREIDGEEVADVRVAMSQPEKMDFGHSLLWHSNFCLEDEIPGVGDFNGDGRDDIVTFKQDTGEVFVALSSLFNFQGDGWLWASDFCYSGDTPLVGDFNGDGRDDIACVSVDDGRSRILVALSNPASVSYTWPVDCHPCLSATHYTKAYWPDICR